MRWLPLRDAHAFVAKHHRHHVPAQGGILAIGIWTCGQLVGCGVIGRPVARNHAEGVCEVTRTCVLPSAEHAASALLGHLRRTAQVLGFQRMVTYTLPTESGISLRAAGWRQDDLAGGGEWDKPGRRRMPADYPIQRKIRWWRDLDKQQELQL